MLSSEANDLPHPNFLTLPLELYPHILFFLDVKDIISLRKTCKHFSDITRDRSIWSTIFAHLRATQVLPYSRTEFTAMSTTQAERALFTAAETETTFLQLRKHIMHYRSPFSNPPYTIAGSAWQVFTFISDRFVLSVDTDAVNIWDTASPPSSFKIVSSPILWARHTLQTYVGHAEYRSKLYIAFLQYREGRRNVAIHSMLLPDTLLEITRNHDKSLHWEAEFPLGGTEIFKYIDPRTCRAVLYGNPSSIRIVHWSESNRRSTIPIQSDDLDDRWNGIISFRLCGPYILCFRVRSVEAYAIPLDGSTANPLPVFRHRFGPVAFRSVSLSRVHVSHCPSGDAHTIFMLSNDPHQGMFHYRIRVTTTPVPAMYVRVLSKGTIQMPDSLPEIPHTREDMIRQTFFGTWSLGSAGLRGVWVDRPRGSIERRVVVFTTHPTQLRIKDDEASYFSGVGRLVSSGDAVDEPQVPTMNGQVVHIIPSYDLRDDITICTVSEWTGRIALGSRVGAITLL